MKVLLVTEYFPPKIFGGGEISAHLLAKELARKKIDVSVLTSSYPELPIEEKKEGFSIYRWLSTGKSPNSLSSNIKRAVSFRKSVRKNLQKFVEKYNPDIIHFLNTTSIVKFSGKPTIATINGYAPFCPKGNLYYKEQSACSGCKPLKYVNCQVNSTYYGKTALPFYLRFNPFFWIVSYWAYKKRNKALKSVQHFIALSGYVKGVIERYDIAANRINVIPNVAEAPETGPILRTVADAAKGKFVILCPGSLDKIKGQEIVIEALSRIKRKNILLVLAGEGPERKNLENLVQKLHLQEKVMFTGNLEHSLVYGLYKICSIVALPSKWPEPLSRVVMESSSFGKPLVATNAGGSPDGVAHGKNGFIVENAEGMAIGIEKLMKKQFLKKASAEARKIFREKFLMEKNIHRIINAYKQLLSENS